MSGQEQVGVARVWLGEESNELVLERSIHDEDVMVARCRASWLLCVTCRGTVEDTDVLEGEGYGMVFAWLILLLW